MTVQLYVISNVHLNIIADIIQPLQLANMKITRARGYRHFNTQRREIGTLPPKLLTLARNALRILKHDVVVVAERTSLWIPTIMRGKGASFIYNEHGAGPHANFKSRRNRFAKHILMPSSGMAEHFRASGHPNAPTAVIGYVKRDFIRQLPRPDAMPLFPQTRPIVIYVPHWKRDKSSWWDLGEEVLAHFAQSDQYNLILAPHLRLPAFDPDFQRRVLPFQRCSNIIIDATSFRLVDQSYIDSADIYLGDGSSQVVEFAERPRPAIFLNPAKINWRSDPRFSHWEMGEVVEDMDNLTPALSRATRRLSHFAPIQTDFVTRMMGNYDGLASERAADVVIQELRDRTKQV